MNWWRRLLLGTIPVMFAVAMAAGIHAEGSGDPRNTSDEYFDAVNNAQCMEHHMEDGFVPFGFGLVDRYTQLPVGEPVDLQMRINHATSYTPHNVHDIFVVVDTEDAPNVEVQAGIGEDLEEAWITQVEDGGAFQTTFEVESGAHTGQVRATVVATDPPLDALGPGELTIRVADKTASGEGEAHLRLDHEHFEAYGPGEQELEVIWHGPASALASMSEATIELELEIGYDQNTTRFAFPVGGTLRTMGDVVIVSIPVVMQSHEPALLDFEIRANAFWEHVSGDGAPEDKGVFHRFMTLSVTGGDEAVVAGDAQPREIPQGPLVVLVAVGLLGWVAILRGSWR